MAAIKTYILAPNFTYHPNTSICMGDIIQDPSDPTKPLSSPPNLSALNTESHLDYDAKLSKHKTHSLQGSVWAKFLETAHESIGGGVSGDVLDRYTMDRLETIYFRKQLTDDEAAERVTQGKVKAAINSGIFGKKPVYMITGLKIARGFRLESGNASKAEVNMAIEAQVSSEVSLGAEISASRTYDVQQSYRSSQDIVFAYQLHIITHKGWRWNKHVDITVYKPKAAFLNEQDGAAEEESVETNAASEADVRAFDDEMPMEVWSAMDGDELCSCIVFGEE
jgi:hypothetical protein